jgi:hypothetical protein
VGHYGKVKLSKEFNTPEEAVEFLNSLEDVFTSYVIPNTISQVSGNVVTSYFAIYYESKEKD